MLRSSDSHYSRASLAATLGQLDADARKLFSELDSLLTFTEWEFSLFKLPFPAQDAEQLLLHLKKVHLHTLIMDAALVQGLTPVVYDRMVTPLLPALNQVATHMSNVVRVDDSLSDPAITSPLPPQPPTPPPNY